MKNYIIDSLKTLLVINILTLIITSLLHFIIIHLNEPFSLIMYPLVFGYINILFIIGFIRKYNYFLVNITENFKEITKLEQK